VAEPTADWQVVVGQQLMERGWVPNVPGALRTSYHRTTMLGIGSLVEVAVLGGGPREVYITVIRQVYWSWPPLIDSR
jgi:hypothetical protein